MEGLLEVFCRQPIQVEVVPAGPGEPMSGDATIDERILIVWVLRDRGALFLEFAHDISRTSGEHSSNGGPARVPTGDRLRHGTAGEEQKQRHDSRSCPCVSALCPTHSIPPCEFSRRPSL